MFAPAATLQLTREERAEIDHLVANDSTPEKLARRARITALAPMAHRIGRLPYWWA